MGDAFDILGLEPAFDLDAAAVERAYLGRSAVLHPDLAAGDAEAARSMATVNLARQTLADPERRANALLARLGGPSKEQERGLPDGFLAGMLETREQIETGAGDREAEARWGAWAAERRAEAITQVGTMFRGLGDPPTASALREIRVRLNQWRYVERLIEQMHRGDGGV